MPAKPVQQPHYFDRFYSGLFTNRNPLYTPKRIVGMAVIPQVDVLIDGLNMEITPQDTLARRPGYPKFCTQAFGVSEWPLAYYSCRLNGTLYNIVDTQTNVYTFDATTKTSIYTKTTTARSFFQQVGNLLYWSDGTVNKKWDGTTVTNAGIVAPTAAPTISNLNFHDIVGGAQTTHAWSANYSYNGPSSGVSTFWFQDTNGNIQMSFLNPGALGKSANSAPKWNLTTGGTTVDGGMLWTNAGPIGTWAANTGTPTYYYTAFNSGPVQSFSANVLYSGALSSQSGAGTLSWTTNALSTSQLRSPQQDGTTKTAFFTGLGFAVPAAATITGIQVAIARANKYGDKNTSVVDNTVKIVKGGSAAGNNKAKTGAWSNAYTVQAYGGPGDLWGSSFAPSDINASNFGVCIDVVNSGSWTGATEQAYLLNPMGFWVFYTLGSVSNAYTSTIILDSNGNLQRIKTLGTTGGSAPTWSKIIGGTTTDNTTTWECLGSGNNLAALLGWDYAYGFHTTSGHISTMSARLSLRAPIIGTGVTVQGYGSDDTQCDRNDIYRNYDGGSLLYYQGSENNVNSSTQWTHIDLSQDTDLNTQLVGPIANANDAPVASMTGLVMHDGRMWGISGNSVNFTAGPDCTNGDPSQSWPPANTFSNFPSTPIALIPHTKGLIVLTQSSPWIVLGGPQTLTYYVRPLPLTCPILNANCVLRDGGTVFVYTANRQLISFDLSSQLEEPGFAIADKLKASFDPSVSCIAIHRSGQDQGIFISDGSTNAYRQSINGGAWSPVAQPVGGINILSSLETSTGTYTLLAGRAVGSDFILGRNVSSFVDGASSTYTGYATFGSMVFVAPGKKQEPVSISDIVLEYTTAGTDLTLSVLPNEISGSFTSIPFTAADPWMLPASATIKMRRHDWIGNQSNLPTQIKHLQLKVTLPTESAKNELLGLAINV